jgi:hypothetical protein
MRATAFAIGVVGLATAPAMADDHATEALLALRGIRLAHLDVSLLVLNSASDCIVDKSTLIKQALAAMNRAGFAESEHDSGSSPTLVLQIYYTQDRQNQICVADSSVRLEQWIDHKGTRVRAVYYESEGLVSGTTSSFTEKVETQMNGHLATFLALWKSVNQ